ncbi:hypothetical protein PsYK624_154130 [Phanerochaete sordida]|uniref:Uncharacterized protein n=1 Tax=Phanerochaete sordida TaxID=48140 RepID=A0A9P3GQT9_9APHY|nr:hypothetical protein PsYK624_154130 [Phanerochaete sordida]
MCDSALDIFRVHFWTKAHSQCCHHVVPFSNAATTMSVFHAATSRDTLIALLCYAVYLADVAVCPRRSML